MLVAILVIVVLQMLFTMACVGHLAKIERITVTLAQAKLQELQMWSGSGGK